MPDDVRELSTDELTQIARGRRIELLISNPDAFPSGPKRRALAMARRCAGADGYQVGDYDGPLALPGAVCDLLLAHPREGESFWCHDCLACGFEVPTQLSQSPCPLCGSAVEYYGRLKRRKNEVSDTPVAFDV